MIHPMTITLYENIHDILAELFAEQERECR